MELLPKNSGLTVEGVFHRYTITKDQAADATVSITNKHIKSNNNIYEYVDVWDNLPGNTKVKFDPTPSLLGNLFGLGAITLDGNGELSNVHVSYQYRYDTCYNPLNDPTCPGFDEAFLQYMLNNNLLNASPNITDPLYDEIIQYQLEQQAEVDEIEVANVEAEETLEDQSFEDKFSVTGTAQQLADPIKQQNLMQELMGVGSLDEYSQISIIDVVTIADVVEIKDVAEIKDNYRALRNLAQDKTHRRMVRAQYEE